VGRNKAKEALLQYSIILHAPTAQGSQAQSEEMDWGVSCRIGRSLRGARWERERLCVGAAHDRVWRCWLAAWPSWWLVRPACGAAGGLRSRSSITAMGHETTRTLQLLAVVDAQVAQSADPIAITETGSDAGVVTAAGARLSR